jgi:hypothetical protein
MTLVAEAGVLLLVMVLLLRRIPVVAKSVEVDEGVLERFDLGSSLTTVTPYPSLPRTARILLALFVTVRVWLLINKKAAPPPR